MLCALAVTTITGMLRVGFIGLHLLVNFPAVHVWHHEVEQYQIGQVGADCPQAFLAAGSSRDLESPPPEDQADKIDHLRLVFYAQDTLWYFTVIHRLPLNSQVPPPGSGNLHGTLHCSTTRKQLYGYG